MKKSDIMEIILIAIVIILATIFIIIYLKKLDYKIMLENEYDYDAYKFSTSEDSITITKYMAEGNLVKQTEAYYIKEGKIINIVEEYYYNSIYNAKQSYESDMRNIGVIAYDSSIIKNVVTHVFDSPDISTDNSEVTSFTTNGEFIKYAEEHIEENFSSYTRIY